MFFEKSKKRFVVEFLNWSQFKGFLMYDFFLELIGLEL